MTNTWSLSNRYTSGVGRLSLALTLLISSAAAADVKITLEKRGNGGSHSSLALDQAGFPVVSFFDEGTTDLKLLHCVNSTCKGKNTIPVLDSEGSVGLYTSLVLDGINPVISYYDSSKRKLKIMRCGDPTCDPNLASITTPDPLINGGLYTSLALDSDRFPVVSYVYDEAGTGLKKLRVLHCNDLNCDPPEVDGKGPESIEEPDPNPVGGKTTSLALHAGNPVVSYRGFVNDGTPIDFLKVLHCDDPKCALDGDRITTPDGELTSGTYTSLALNGNGHPVVAFDDTTTPNGAMKVLVCGDPKCEGPYNTINQPDPDSGAANFISLRLDGAYRPVISYYAPLANSLKLTRCNDLACAPVNATVASPDTRIKAYYTSLRLRVDSYFPVVSYYDVDHGNLIILTCDDPNCQ